jgi:uncharacterized membrane protein YkoI
MRTLQSFTLGLPALLLACGTAGTPDSSADTDARQLLQRQLASAQITLEQAIDIAVAAHPGSVALEADLEGDDDTVLFEVELLLGAEVLEVEIDALTGEIVAVEVEDADDEADGEEEDDEEEEDDDDDEVGGDAEEDDDDLLDCSGSISAEEATAIAEAATSATAVEVEIEDDCEIEVTLEGANGFVEVELAADGTVLEIEEDEDAEDEDAAQQQP